MVTNPPFSAALKALLDAFAEALAQDDLDRASILAADLREIWPREQPGENARLELEALLHPLEDLRRLASSGETASDLWITEDPRYRSEWSLYDHNAILEDPFSTTRSGKEFNRDLVFPVWFGTNRQPVDPADFNKGFTHRRAGTV